jgi:hypothetical protein
MVDRFDGSLGEANKLNFQREWFRVMQRLTAEQPELSPEVRQEAAAQEAIRKISFGKHRADAGYGNFKVDFIGDFKPVDLGPLGTQTVPDTIYVKAWK